MIAVFLIVSSNLFGAGVSVVFLEQSPDPVSPGAIVELSFDIFSQDVEENVRFSVVDNSYFNAVGENLKYLGSVSTRTRAKFQVKVSESTPVGLNRIDTIVSSSKGEVRETFEIEVKEKHPKLIIKSVEVGQIEPGSSSVMKITLENTNFENLRNVELKLGLSQIQEQPLSLKVGNTQFFTNLIRGNSKHTFEVELLASPNAKSQPYFIPFELTYENLDGEQFESLTDTSVRVYAKPYHTLRIDSQDSYEVGEMQVTLSIANPSQSMLKGVEVEISEGAGYEVIKGSYHYIGDLNSDDFQTLQSDILVTELDSDLFVKIRYSDSYNQKIIREEILPLTIYTDEKLKQLEMSNKKSGFGFLNFFYLVVVFVVGLFAGIYKERRRKRKFRH